MQRVNINHKASCTVVTNAVVNTIAYSARDSGAQVPYLFQPCPCTAGNMFNCKVGAQKLRAWKMFSYIQALELCSYHIYQKYSYRQVYANYVNSDQEQSDQLDVLLIRKFLWEFYFPE